MVDLPTGQARAQAVSRRRYKRKPYQPISPDKFYETRRLANLSKQEVACLLHVTARTVALWEAGSSRIPYAAYKLLRILTGYELPGEAWKGWFIRGDTLWDPTNRPYQVGYLSYHSLTFSMARHWLEEHRAKPKAAGAGFLGDRRLAGGAGEPDAAPPLLRLVGL